MNGSNKLATSNIFKLPEKHKKALEWFQIKTNTIVSWPDKLSDGTLLVTKAKGIYKPRWSDYALSLRQSLNSEYDDSEVMHLSGAAWQFKYCPERGEQMQMCNIYTNKALLKNMKDAIPVGVIVQVKTKPNPLYKIMGLGYVKELCNGLFVIESYNNYG